MARELPTGFSALLTQKTVPGAFLVQLNWPDGTVYMWNGYHSLVWNGQTWLGLGHLGGISEVKESTDLAANGLNLTLSGVPSANVAKVLRNDTQGRPGKVFFGILNSANPGAFTVDPLCIFDGVIDNPSLSDDGKTATIEVPLEKEFIDNRSAASRYTHEDQKQLYPLDKGLEFVAGLADKTFTWGKSTIYPATTPGSGNGDGDEIGRAHV